MNAPRTMAILIVRENSWARKKKKGKKGTKKPTQTPWSIVDQYLSCRDTSKFRKGVGRSSRRKSKGAGDSRQGNSLFGTKITYHTYSRRRQRLRLDLSDLPSIDLQVPWHARHRLCRNSGGWSAGKKRPRAPKSTHHLLVHWFLLQQPVDSF